MTQRTGVSQSTLSRLESGQRRPSLELLLPLAQAYGVPLDDLVGAPRTGDPRVHLKPIRRKGYTFVPLTGRAGGIQAYKMVIPRRMVKAGTPLQTHEGHEWLYVLDGRLRIVLGREEYVLDAGEVAEFDTSQPHALDSADGRPVEVLILFGAQGERAHVHPTR